MDIKRVMIYAEQASCRVEASFFELLSKAKENFGDSPEYAAVIIGSDFQGEIEELKASGVDKVYVMDDKRLWVYNPEFHARATVEAIKQFDPCVFLIGATACGEEIAPTVGQIFHTGVAAHCVNLIYKEDGTFAQMVPAFGGKVIGEIFTPNTRPMMASVKPGMFVATPQPARAGEVINLDPAILDEVRGKIKTIDSRFEEMKKLPVDKADVVVCGGFGMGGQENWNLLEQLASMIGAAVGSTRPPVDETWVENDANMIGTSGKSVRPKLYIGTGISGATHHVCGIKDAGTIISINCNADAEIFQASDYKVVGDGATILKKVIELIQQEKDFCKVD